MTLALSYIQHSGPFSIRYCNRTLGSNGVDMLGGSFKVKKSLRSSADSRRGFGTSFPSAALHSSGRQSSVMNKKLYPQCAAQNQTQPQTADNQPRVVAKPQDNHSLRAKLEESNACGAGGYPSHNLLHKVCEEVGVFYYHG